MNWQKMPTSIRSLRCKLTALQKLCGALLKDKDVGGYRVEVRVEGYGNSILWVRDVVELLDSKMAFTADVRMKELHVLDYLETVSKQLESLQANIQGRNDLKLAATHPFLVKLKALRQTRGYSVEAKVIRPRSLSSLRSIRA